MTGRKFVVYIASPYTEGDVAMNVRFQHQTWDLLWRRGFVPVAPLWSHYQHLSIPMPYHEWLEYDAAIVRRSDAVLRLTATGPRYEQQESAGADKEVELAKSLGIPVLESVGSLVLWSRRACKLWPVGGSA